MRARLFFFFMRVGSSVASSEMLVWSLEDVGRLRWERWLGVPSRLGVGLLFMCQLRPLYRVGSWWSGKGMGLLKWLLASPLARFVGGWPGGKPFGFMKDTEMLMLGELGWTLVLPKSTGLMDCWGVVVWKSGEAT